MSTRNERAWASYDNWLLKGSGVDDPYIEVFETDKYKKFSTNEDNVAKFDDLMFEHEKENYCKESYTDKAEFIEECVENLADELGLHDDESDAEVEYWENYQDEKQAAIEEKAEQKMQARKDGEI